MTKKYRLLIVAIAWSSHTQSWVELIDKQIFKLKVFNFDFGEGSSSEISKTSKLYFTYKIYSFIKTILLWLTIKLWRPDIIHSLGLFPASAIVEKLKKSISNKSTWVVTARGGPELALWRLTPVYKTSISRILSSCNFFIADNLQNYNYALELGLSRDKISSLGVTPGSGGIDISFLNSLRKTRAVESRVIVFPKTYECPASKALPVFEAIKICWDQIKPCTIYFTAVNDETRFWFQALPEEIKQNCILLERLPRTDLFKLFAESRVVIMPSLIDGIPNTLYETMACGAVPIVSPIETISEVFEKDVNVLFARNLYPQEIAGELIRAMTDNSLAEKIVANNYTLVSEIADKNTISTKMNKFYNDLLT